MQVQRVAQLPIPRPTLRRTFGLMAESLVFETNDERVLAAAERSFGRFSPRADTQTPLRIRLFVDPSRPSDASRPAPADAVSDRTYEHLFVSVAGGRDVAVTDLDAGLATGFVTEATARNEAVLRRSFVEAMGLSMLGRSRGYFVLHAAGVAGRGAGLVLAGSAGSGKSTLAVAAARRGYRVFAEDGVFVKSGDAEDEFWGMPWTQRVLPDARRLFPELAGLIEQPQVNGESKLDLDLDVLYPGSATPVAEPGPVILLRRGDATGTRLESLAGSAPEDLEVLWPWDGGWTPSHQRSALRLLRRGVYRLHIGGSPDDAVDAIAKLLGPPPVTR